MRRTKRFIADLETLYLTEEEIKNGARVYAWAWALCDCKDYTIRTGSSMKTFFEELQKIGNN